jgi:hypothetical protein
MAEDTDSEEVVESKNVRDLSGEEIDDEIDEMLGDDDDHEKSELEAEAEDDGEQELRPEIEKQKMEAEKREEEGGTSFDFEEQEWTLDERREPEVREFRGMKLKFAEPENDDNVLNKLEQASGDDRDAQMRSLVQIVVQKPEVTKERWDSMSLSAKLALAGQAADYLDLDEGFLEE